MRFVGWMWTRGYSYGCWKNRIGIADQAVYYKVKRSGQIEPSNSTHLKPPLRATGYEPEVLTTLVNTVEKQVPQLLIESESSQTQVRDNFLIRLRNTAETLPARNKCKPHKTE